MIEKINNILNKKKILPNMKRIGEVKLNGISYFFHPDREKLEQFCKEKGLNPNKIFKRTNNWHIKSS